MARSVYARNGSGDLMLACLICTVVAVSSIGHHDEVDGHIQRTSNSEPLTPSDVLRVPPLSRTNGSDTARSEKHKESKKVQSEARSHLKQRHSFFELNGPGCKQVMCQAHEVCVTKSLSDREAASCVDRKLAHFRVARGRDRRQDSENSAHGLKQLDEKVQRMKAQAQEFEMHRERKQQKRLQWMLSTKHPFVSTTQNDSTEKTPIECHRRDLDAVGQSLLDQFKQQQDEHSGKRRKEKRNSTKKELHEDDECICQSPVSWQFQRLDVDADGQLINHETDALHVNVNIDRHCLTAFFRACDHSGDLALSEKEWCCCFADVLPPCLTAMKMVPSILFGGQPSVVPGAFVPQCDDDGFYKPLQCDASSGRCWCVDRNGHKLGGTTNDESPNC